MKYFKEYQDPLTARRIIQMIESLQINKINIMEVCGTHTAAIFKYGIKNLLPPSINLISGPGCPVCVSSLKFLDNAILLAQQPNIIITTFGDMLRVPGNNSSLQQEKRRGADIRVVLSPLAALKIAQRNPAKIVIFLAVGFETTAPVIALSIIKARELGLKNFFLLQSLKTMPAILRKLTDDKKIKIAGMICPGHVAVITGSRVFQFLAEKQQLPAVIAGFTGNELLLALLELLKMIKSNKKMVINQYKRVVTPNGNLSSLNIINQVFKSADSDWRGIGLVKQSGLKLRAEFNSFSAEKRFNLTINPGHDNPGCSCGEILKGIYSPVDCLNFKKSCTPEHPIGPCMVSQEGTCAIYYRYSNIPVSSKNSEEE